MKDKELRIGVIKSKIEQITDTIETAEENFPADFEEFKNSRLVRDAVYKEIEFVIQTILDICAIINSDLKLGIPETEDSILDNLESKKIFEKKIIDLIREMKGFRNILVHKYGEINDEQAFETIKDGLKDFDDILEEIDNILKKY